jgi:hypothetical protein
MSEVNDSSSDAPVTDTDSTESDEGGAEVVEPVVAPAKNVRKIKYKSDGQDFEDEIDFNDDKAIAKHLSMSKAAYKRMQEAASTRSQAEQLFKMLQQDPEKILSHEQFGGPKALRAFAEKVLARQLEDEMMSPEEKHRRTQEERLKKYEEQEKEVKTKAEAEQMQKLEAHYANEFQAKIIKGLASQNIPKTPRTVKRMAELMSKNLQHGLDLEPEQLAEIVYQDHLNDMKELFGSTEGDMLLKLLGDDTANKIRKSDLARLRNGGQFQAPATPKQRQSSGQSSAESRGSMSKEEWKAWIEKNAKD